MYIFKLYLCPSKGKFKRSYHARREYTLRVAQLFYLIDNSKRLLDDFIIFL